MKRFAFYCIWCIWVLCCGSGALYADPRKETFTHAAMGTIFEFTLYARPGDDGTDDIRRIAEEAFDIVDDLDNRISVWKADSQISYVNRHAAEEPVKAAPDIIDLLLYCRKVNRESGGAFDITVGPLVKCWGFYKSEGILPTGDVLRDALAYVGMDKVNVDSSARTIKFAKPGVLLDFGGVGKGLALDRAARAMRAHGVKAAVLNAGTSSILAIGAPPGLQGWRVQIYDPYRPGHCLDEVTLCDASLSTSGNYEKFFEIGGKKYCHIFDPRTGKPVEGMLSASAIADTATETDALSTSFFVMGEAGVRAYCDAHKGIRAIMAPIPENGKPMPVRIGFETRP
ncbi:MAG TPA: FAD:protein FMN transferase [Candidatus Hydrogenedentes bacterium]|nr:FAD:protein FMN transferase [Candidatus Hydrogenedentota bacterium]HOT51013.1 FAD:protein FMN transferase [Candidatus Hydrogenedentota bacterium]HPC17898.1 FAD:protein FMN transferase [Candidatus Hydrogenedentota bacterium]HRT21243.1 FAD:protein FMN transferase [Candidatus Hydrogenedentota bacterium]HRT65105.1 FAD:protein FMN transferase [Candidatus Hydrogenedentota bacterium]